MLSILITSCDQKPQSSITKDNKAQSLKDSLTLELTEIQENGFFNGFGVTIVNEEGVLYEKGFGYANREQNKKYTENTIQHIASISKTLIGCYQGRISRI